MKRLAVLCALAASLVAADASAQQRVAPDVLGAPNAWDRAKDPEAAHDFALHVTVSRMLAQAAVAGDDMSPFDAHALSIRDNVLSRAYLALLAAFKDGSTDPRLRYDLGEVLYEQRRYDAAAEVLEKVLHDAPTEPQAHHAWLTLAFSEAHRDRPDDERAGYEKFLEDEPASGERIIALLNLAEADMRTHRLADAVAGYREVEKASSALSGATRTGVLAVWGLAIALDRSGDARAAAQEARLASHMDPEDRVSQRRPIIGDTSSVFFVPEYEIYWYLALGSTEDARQAPNAEMAKYLWGRVVSLWKAYLKPAEGIEHPEAWNAIAKSHLAAAEKQLKSATDRAAKEPKPAQKRPPPDDPL